MNEHAVTVLLCLHVGDLSCHNVLLHAHFFAAVQNAHWSSPLVQAVRHLPVLHLNRQPWEISHHCIPVLCSPARHHGIARRACQLSHPGAVSTLLLLLLPEAITEQMVFCLQGLPTLSDPVTRCLGAHPPLSHIPSSQLHHQGNTFLCKGSL